MLTRDEVVDELRRIGIKEPSVLKKYLEDFEHYMRVFHGLTIATTKVASEEEIIKKNPPYLNKTYIQPSRFRGRARDGPAFFNSHFDW